MADKENQNTPQTLVAGERESKPVYAVIMPSLNETSGLGYLYVYIFSRLVKATENGYIPVIDLRATNNQYFKDSKKYQDNVWEYYFKQPCGISPKDLENINDNSQIKICTQDSDIIKDQLPTCTIKLERADSKKNIAKFPYKKETAQYIKLSDEAQLYINERFNNLVGNEKEILGILCRGTDYIKLKPKYHTIPAAPEMLIKEAMELREKYHYKKIYVATEDLEIYNKFKKAFGDMLIPNNQYKFGEYENPETTRLSDIKINRPNHRYQLGMEYLCSMYFLSQCKYFISSNSCYGVDLVSAFSGFCKNMEYVHIWDMGIYGYSKFRYKNVWEKIFSVKNQQDDNIRRKVLTILGIKFKFIKK